MSSKARMLIPNCFAALGVVVYVYFIYQLFHNDTNLWIFFSGTLLWLLAVADAKINELCNKAK